VRSSYAGGLLTTPKSGRLRSVPLSTQVATALARLADRGWSTGDDDLVFVGEFGDYVDGSALRRRYMDALATAGLRPLRFHDLRHTFGTRMIAKADILRVKEWMGHADVQTSMRYLYYVPRPDDARLVDEAFALEDPAALSASVDGRAAARSGHRGQAGPGSSSRSFPSRCSPRSAVWRDVGASLRGCAEISNVRPPRGDPAAHILGR